MISQADGIICLTEASKKEILKWFSYKGSPISVIPCCADYRLFSLRTNREKIYPRESLEIKKDDFVLSYLGSTGSWYLLENMLDFFKVLLEVKPHSIFLFITRDKENVIKAAQNRNIPLDKIRVISASRVNVPVFMKASDVSICFIKNTYSKKASSPTKLAETWALGIPVIMNSGIGDSDDILKQIKVGFLINSLSQEGYQKAIQEFSKLKMLSDKQIRDESRKYFDLDIGVKSYDLIYNDIIEAPYDK